MEKSGINASHCTLIFSDFFKSFKVIFPTSVKNYRKQCIKCIKNKKYIQLTFRGDS